MLLWSSRRLLFIKDKASSSNCSYASNCSYDSNSGNSSRNMKFSSHRQLPLQQYGFLAPTMGTDFRVCGLFSRCCNICCIRGVYLGLADADEAFDIV